MTQDLHLIRHDLLHEIKKREGSLHRCAHRNGRHKHPNHLFFLCICPIAHKGSKDHILHAAKSVQVNIDSGHKHRKHTDFLFFTKNAKLLL